MLSQDIELALKISLANGRTTLDLTIEVETTKDVTLLRLYREK